MDDIPVDQKKRQPYSSRPPGVNRVPILGFTEPLLHRNRNPVWNLLRESIEYTEPPSLSTPTISSWTQCGLPDRMLAVSVAAPLTVIASPLRSSKRETSAASVLASDCAWPTRPAVVSARLSPILKSFWTLLFATKWPMVALWSAPTTTPPLKVIPTVSCSCLYCTRSIIHILTSIGARQIRRDNTSVSQDPYQPTVIPCMS